MCAWRLICSKLSRLLVWSDCVSSDLSQQCGTMRDQSGSFVRDRPSSRAGCMPVTSWCADVEGKSPAPARSGQLQGCPWPGAFQWQVVLHTVQSAVQLWCCTCSWQRELSTVQAEAALQCRLSEDVRLGCAPSARSARDFQTHKQASGCLSTPCAAGSAPSANGTPHSAQGSHASSPYPQVCEDPV